ncbi:MAG: copper chaperone PCu(A)C [Rhizobiaceae bacterium]|nr:copper chaperone PCu(A)C [Rhizobiaceae bacterium]
MKNKTIPLILFALIVAGAAAAILGFGDAKNNGKVIISNAVAAPIDASEEALILTLSLNNEGPPQTIVGISSPDASDAAIHGTEGSGKLVLPANGQADFSPESAHILLSGIEGELTEGRLLTIKVDLEPAGSVTTKARIEAKAKTPHGSHQTNMPKMEHSGHANQSTSTGQSQNSDHSAHSNHTVDSNHSGHASQGERSGHSADSSKMEMIHVVTGSEAKPDLQINAFSKPDQTGWQISADVSNFEFDRELADGDHVTGTGHGHIYLNGLKLGRLYNPTLEIGELPKGTHTLRITLNTNDHRIYVVDGKPVSKTVELDVE